MYMSAYNLSIDGYHTNLRNLAEVSVNTNIQLIPCGPNSFDELSNPEIVILLLMLILFF